MTASVVIPLYNREAFIRRAIGSVLAQTHQDLELIVVDDGSTDDGLTMVKAIADSRVRIISQTNQGPGAARNRGAAAASSDYLAFLDADDEWMPEFLGKSLAALERAPDCGFCITAFYDGPGKRVSQTQLEARGYTGGRYTVSSTTRPDSFDWLLYAYLPSTAVFRRKTFEACGGFYARNGCKFGEDMYLFVTASLRCSFWRLADALVWYHSEDSSLATQTNVLTALLLDPRPAFDLCPEQNKSVLRGLLADRAVQESLGHAYRGDFTTWMTLFEQFECRRFSGRRARNARRQIHALRVIAPFARWAPGLVRRALNRLFPLSAGDRQF